MKKKTPEKTARRSTPELAEGLHGATIELHAGERYRVRTLQGVAFDAVLADQVAPALADECLRTGKMVLVTGTTRGVTIVGALQTAPSPMQDANGALSIDAEHVRLRAERSMVLEVGPVTLRLEDTGAVRFQGERLVIDMSALVRFASMRVELP